jgi:hypothetical protein
MIIPLPSPTWLNFVDSERVYGILSSAVPHTRSMKKLIFKSCLTSRTHNGKVLMYRILCVTSFKTDDIQLFIKHQCGMIIVVIY